MEMEDMTGILNREAITELFNNVENGDIKLFGKITDAIMLPSERRALIRKIIHPDTNMCFLATAIENGR